MSETKYYLYQHTQHSRRYVLTVDISGRVWIKDNDGWSETGYWWGDIHNQALSIIELRENETEMMSMNI